LGEKIRNFRRGLAKMLTLGGLLSATTYNVTVFKVTVARIIQRLLLWFDLCAYLMPSAGKLPF